MPALIRRSAAAEPPAGLPRPVDTGEVAAGDGTRLYVCEYGTSNAPLTVVFLHGWELDLHTWDRQLGDLPGMLDTPIRIVGYEHRGHGRSGRVPVDAATLEWLGDDLATVLRERVPSGPVVLAGHSLGGMTVMALAERHPDLFARRVAGVAFVASSSGALDQLTFGLPSPLLPLIRVGQRGIDRTHRWRSTRGQRGQTSGSAGANRRRGGRPTRLATRPGMRWLLFGRRPATADLDRTLEAVLATPTESLVGFHTALATHQRRDALAACRGIPTVVAVGGEDRLTPPSHARVIARAVPGSRLVIYPGAGHMLPLERADEITAQLAHLIRASSAARR